MATKKKPKQAKKPEPLSPFTGRKQNHMRTGAKYGVMQLRRSGSNNKGAAISNSGLRQFATKKDADAWAKSESRRNTDSAYTVIGTDGFDKKLKDTYTHGKVNESLTSELKKAYKDRDDQRDYQSRIELLK